MCVDNNMRIARLMDDRGLKPYPFAKSIGVKSSTMTSIYKGRVNFESISISNFLKIAKGLGMTAEELYYGDKKEQSRPQYADSRQQEINDAYDSVNADGKHVMWTNAIMARTTFPDGVERDFVQEVAE